MMQKICTCFSFLLLSFSCFAHHIVGGDLTISLINAAQHKYKITLTFLFDQVNGSSDAEDALEVVTIFDKGTNGLIKSYILNKVSNNTYLPYTSSACNTAELKTRIIIYADTMVLSPNVYNNSYGYYMAWERCCRTDELLNILHPDSSGVVFYAEFPPILQNGKAFLDSTPSFTKLKGDYACVNEYYALDFSAIDTDGDSLSYALVAPIKGFTTASNPAPYTSDAGPYSNVDFPPGISVSNMIPGPVHLSIDAHTGWVKGMASTAGLYVFAVACSEYRSGLKIGEIRRDYVFYVKDDCAYYTSPKAGLKEANKLYTQQTDTLILHDTQLDLFNIFAIDSSNNDLSIGWISGNFPLSEMNYTNATGHVQSIHDTVTAQAQWKDCGNNPMEVYKAYAVASKFACPIPRTDTLTIWFKIEPPINHPLHLYTSLTNDSAVVYKDEHLNFQVFATDPDTNDLITLSRIKEVGFQGGDFNTTSGLSAIFSPFDWEPQCEDIKSNPSHDVYFMATDNSCYLSHKDTVIVTIQSLQHSIDLNSLTFYNLATPNGDYKNDELTLPPLPPDNCDQRFMSIEMYNRYGNRVYYSTHVVESIPVEHLSDGIYYYSVNYSNTESYKGWVQIIR